MRDRVMKAAEEGNIYAMLAVAYMYRWGKGLDPDAGEAIRWFERSAERGCSRAKWELCKIYRSGEMVPPDTGQYLKYLRQAADAGIPEARVEIAGHYAMGDLVERNDALATSWNRAAANQGSAFAAFRLGYAYMRGLGVDEDPAEAEKWFAKATQSGDADLFYRIGLDYEYGYEGVQEDLFEAGRWYRIGADMGHDRCYIALQHVLKALDGGKRDTPEERQFLIQQTPSAVEERVRDGALETADQELDDGDEGNAFKDYQRAAGLGNAVAMYMLAIMYHDGVVVKRNDRLALDYLTKAALSGSADAQLALGYNYEAGRGPKKDLDEAIKYYAMAAAGGNLVGYYELGRHMQHPEIYVRNTQTIVR